MMKRSVCASILAAVLMASAAPAATGIGNAPKALAEERLAIENALQDYVRALDGTDLDVYLATLTDDARFLSKEGNYIGKKAIADYVGPVLENRRKRRAAGTDPVKGTHHVITNQQMSFEDAAHAVVKSYWMFVSARKEGGITIDSMGASEDHLVKQGGRWLIQERRVDTL
jgi:3-phenylpropionate/cinnamic acid dioxygenase small subunit